MDDSSGFGLGVDAVACTSLDQDGEQPPFNKQYFFFQSLGGG